MNAYGKEERAKDQATVNSTYLETMKMRRKSAGKIEHWNRINQESNVPETKRDVFQERESDWLTIQHFREVK